MRISAPGFFFPPIRDNKVDGRQLYCRQLRASLNDEHYLKAGRPAGNTIWQGIYQTDSDEGYPVLCAVLCWSGAALRLKERDEWIDRDPLTRGSRPILAQSFSDPQLHEGTIYKTSNWTPLGGSKGFKRHKSEFYTDEKNY